MKRQKILQRPSAGTEPFSHLRPIVECLIGAGNRPVGEKVFYMDRDGWRCDLRNPIDFELLEAKFEFPSSISLSPEHDAILDRLSWVEIKGGRKAV